MNSTIFTRRTTSFSSSMVINFRCCLFVFLQLSIVCVQDVVLRSSTGGMQWWCQNACIFIALNIALQAASFHSMGGALSLGSLFLVCSYLVNCSFCILIAFDAQGADSALMVTLLPRFGLDSFIGASRYALNCICYVAAGYFLAQTLSFRSGDELTAHRMPNSMAQNYYSVGKALTVVFGIVYFVSTAIMIFMSFRSGSYASMTEAMSLPFMSDAVNFHPFFFAGLFLLMAHYKQIGRLDVSKRLMVFAVLSLVFSFFSGVRSRGTMQLLVLLVIWTVCIDRPKPKTVLIGTVFGIVILQLMAAIRSVRTVGLSFESVATAFFSLENSLIYEVLNEYGSSLFATAGLMNWVNQTHPVDFLARQIGSVLPAISAWGGEIFLSPTVRTGFESAYHLGSTYVAETFYYFGSAGPYISAVLGIWIALLDKHVWRKAAAGDYLAVAVAMPGILSVFNSTRASMDFGFKMFLYSALIIYLLSLIISSERNYKKGHRHPFINKSNINGY